jgi:MFS family permease
MNPRLPSLTSKQWRLLLVLSLINLIAFAERMIVPPLFPVLRLSLHLSSAQLGWLQTLLQIVLAVATIPFALLADRMDRRILIAIGVLFAGLASCLTIFAQGYLMLLVMRALVGVGEASYSPAAQSMITSAVPANRRAIAQAIFAAGMLLGGTAAQALGGVIGGTEGWRAAFFYIGVPGVLLAFTVLRVAEPARHIHVAVMPARALFRVPAFVCMLISGVLITFSVVAFATWGTDFIVRYKDFSLREAGVSLGATLFTSSLLGVLTGGAVADRLQKYFTCGRIYTVIIGFLAAAPAVLWAIATEEKQDVIIAFFIAGFFMSWYHGPVTAVIHDLMPESAHSTSVGMYMFVTQLFGGMLGPVVIGMIDDMSDLLIGLKVAVAVMVIGALCMFLVVYFVKRDGMRHAALAAWHSEARPINN